jgi:hypothetical protein
MSHLHVVREEVAHPESGRRQLHGSETYHMSMANATIARDLACSKCRYNLRGLDAGSNCPECGVPIQWTLAQHLSRPRRRFHYTRRLCVIAPSLYIVWVLFGLLAGGKGGAFFATDAFYRLMVVFRLFGVES